MTKFIIIKRTDAYKTDDNLLNRWSEYNKQLQVGKALAWGFLEALFAYLILLCSCYTCCISKLLMRSHFLSLVEILFYYV